jgi:hypothetical protein
MVLAYLRQAAPQRSVQNCSRTLSDPVQPFEVEDAQNGDAMLKAKEMGDKKQREAETTSVATAPRSRGSIA